MHTTEYTHDSASPSRVWVIHNSDFSGDCFVGFQLNEHAPKFEWTVDGDELLSGDFNGTPVYMLDGDSRPVPYWVVGRAVRTVVRCMMQDKILNLVGDL